MGGGSMGGGGTLPRISGAARARRRGPPRGLRWPRTTPAASAFIRVPDPPAGFVSAGAARRSRPASFWRPPPDPSAPSVSQPADILASPQQPPPRAAPHPRPTPRRRASGLPSLLLLLPSEAPLLQRRLSGCSTHTRCAAPARRRSAPPPPHAPRTTASVLAFPLRRPVAQWCCMEHKACQARLNQAQRIGSATRLCSLTCLVQHWPQSRTHPALARPRPKPPRPHRTAHHTPRGWKHVAGHTPRAAPAWSTGTPASRQPMAHSPHANIPEHARLQPGSSHVARRADAYLIALVSRSAAMRTWENHADVIAPPCGLRPSRPGRWHGTR